MTVDATVSPQEVRRLRPLAGRVEGVRDLVELVREQVAAQVERHRSGLVAEHRLHDLDVGAGRDGQARRCVAKQVGMKPASPIAVAASVRTVRWKLWARSGTADAGEDSGD